MNIFIGSLPFSIEEADLRESFEAYGPVSSVKIITDRETGRSKGFGFVEMPDDNEALKAIEELNGATVQGRTIVVNKAEPRPQQDNRRSFGNNRGGGGFNRNNNRSGGGFNRGGGDYNRGGNY